MGNLLKTLHNIFNRKRTGSTGYEAQPSKGQELLYSSLAENFAKIKQAFGGSRDVIAGEFNFGPANGYSVGFVYLDGLADSKVIQEMIKQSLLIQSNVTDQQRVHTPNEQLERVKNNMPAIGETKLVYNFSSLYQSILSGETVILVDGCDCGLSANTISGNKNRSIEEPTTQSVVRGPREGFIENLHSNVSMIRKRVRTPDLWLETMTIGKVTKTGVGIMYINGIVNNKIVEEVRIRLARIDIDGILESGNIEELIQDETYTPFPTLFNSERPDVIAAGLLEGRVAVLIDGTPFVLLAPALFVQFFQSAEDYYQRADFATLIRLLRYICFFISLLAPSFYIAITTFHQELLPSSLLFSLAAQREGIPFPAFVEAVLMEVIFEILREAGVRLPRTVGQAVSIVGALVIGQAAVEAGLVSPAMVIIVAITAIANFVIPAFNMGISLRILRFILMIFAATFGLFGVTVGLIAIVQHLCSLRSFGVPYMAPMAPFIFADQKDTILRFPQWGLFSRPRFISQKNIIRENNAPTTKPERKGK